MTKPDIVELHDIHAKVQLQDNGIIQLSAATGIYDTKGETLKLARDIVLTSSTGYECRLSEALVDTRKGNVLSEHPVEVKMLQGTLNANRLEVVDSGDLVRFGGGVDMVLTLNQADASQAKAGRDDYAAHPLFRSSLPRALLSSAPVDAQPSKGPPNALQGFSQNRDQPVHIEAATLEVRDKDKVATFSGNVHVTQGDTGMRCKSLVVYYEQNVPRPTRAKAWRWPIPARAASSASRSWKRAAASW